MAQEYQPTEPRPPWSNPRYRAIRRIGKGGFGEVWLADDTQTAAKVAVKALSLDEVPDEYHREIIAKFQEEAALLRRINDPNIVKGSDAFQERDGRFLVLEYVSGGNLAQLIKDHPSGLPIAEARRLALQLLAALVIVHREGKIHRDVTPANVLLSPADPDAGRLSAVKLADFGIMRDLGAGVTSVIRIGTPRYMAYEQCNGARYCKAGPWTDLFSFGAIFFQLLTGQHPFPPSPDRDWAVVLNEEDQPRTASALRPELDHWPGLDAFLARLLQHDGRLRPQSAAEARRLLDAIEHRDLAPVEAALRDVEAALQRAANVRPGSSVLRDAEAREALNAANAALATVPTGALAALAGRVRDLRDRLDATLRSPAWRDQVRFDEALAAGDLHGAERTLAGNPALGAAAVAALDEAIRAQYGPHRTIAARVRRLEGEETIPTGYVEELANDWPALSQSLPPADQLQRVADLWNRRGLQPRFETPGSGSVSAVESAARDLTQARAALDARDVDRAFDLSRGHYPRLNKDIAAAVRAARDPARQWSARVEAADAPEHWSELRASRPPDLDVAAAQWARAGLTPAWTPPSAARLAEVESVWAAKRAGGRRRWVAASGLAAAALALYGLAPGWSDWVARFRSPETQDNGSVDPPKVSQEVVPKPTSGPPVEPTVDEAAETKRKADEAQAAKRIADEAAEAKRRAGEAETATRAAAVAEARQIASGARRDWGSASDLEARARAIRRIRQARALDPANESLRATIGEWTREYTASAIESAAHDWEVGEDAKARGLVRTGRAVAPEQSAAYDRIEAKWEAELRRERSGSGRGMFDRIRDAFK